MNPENLEVDHLVTQVHTVYSKCKFKPSNDRQFTILASFVLHALNSKIEVISVATGSKCLPESQLPLLGNAIHDSHAEILSRRGAVRWFYEELSRCNSRQPKESIWIDRGSDEKWRLKPGVRLVLYISGIPCR